MIAVKASAALLTAISISALAQPAPKFEVASVKIAPPRTGAAALIAMDRDPAMIRYSNVTLRILIAVAYRFDSSRIRGVAGWLDEQPYDVSAKMPDGVSADQMPAMLQVLLSERFKLVVHRESKDDRVYFLVLGKGGSKLKETPQTDHPEGVEQVRGNHPPAQIMPGWIAGDAIPIETLAAALSRVTGYVVADRTGLSKTYKIDLKWAPEDKKESGPSIFDAIQEQLGLKLEAGRGPVEVLVIDHAERVPTAE
jgi:uncharacterized protein (TIGR03435 family)